MSDSSSQSSELSENDASVEDIMTAAAHGNISQLQSLVEQSPSGGKVLAMEQKNWNDNTCAHWACEGGHTSSLEYICKHSPSGFAMLEQKDCDGENTAHWAASHGKISTLEFICSNCPSGVAIMFVRNTNHRVTALEQLLVTLGWDSPRRKHPFLIEIKAHLAAQRGDTPTLASRCAQYPTRILASLENMRNNEETSIHCAARGGHISTLEFMCAHCPSGVAIMCIPNSEGKPPLDLVM